MLMCAVYSVFRVAKVITQKKPKEQEEQSLCDSCTHLERKGCGIDVGKYRCDYFNESFNKSPEFCRNYERREEKKEPTEITLDESQTKMLHSARIRHFAEILKNEYSDRTVTIDNFIYMLNRLADIIAEDETPKEEP